MRMGDHMIILSEDTVTAVFWAMMGALAWGSAHNIMCEILDWRNRKVGVTPRHPRQVEHS